MAAKQQLPANRVYEDFNPTLDWAREQDHDTLILVLPGFKREQLKVQVTSTRFLKVSGERLVDNNKWRRFEKEFPIASNIDANSITAKYEGGMLYIKHPKVMTLTRSREQAKPTAAAPRPQQKPQSYQPRPTQESAQQPPPEAPRPQQMPKSYQPRPTQESAQQPPPEAPRPQQMPKSDQPRPTQKSAREQAAQQVSSKSPNADKQTEGKTTAQAQGNEISEAKKDSRKTPVPEMEKELPSEHGNKKQSTYSPDSDNVSQKTGEKETIGSSEKAGKVAGKKDKRPITENDEQEGYTQWVYSLAMELMKPKKLMNLIVAALLVVVFVLYAKLAAKQPIREPESKLP